MDLKLLLATQEGEPYLKHGVPLILAARAQRPDGIPQIEPPGPTHLVDSSASPNDLSAQRWGVLVPAEGGDQLLDRIRPLVELRQNEQGAPIFSYAEGARPIIEGRPFKVPRGQNAQQAAQWIQDNLNRMPEALRPRYLLILGGLDQISLELQQALSVYYFVGRLAFPELDGYSEYAAKVVAYARPERWRRDARALGYAVRTEIGCDAPDDAYVKMLCPVVEYTKDVLSRCPLAFEDVSPKPGQATARDLLLRVEEDRPTILLSVSHGQARSLCANSWSDEEQLRFQGQMFFGYESEPLSAELVRKGSFFPGGMWFYFACYGAGTPATSAYHHWLQRVKPEQDVTYALPRNGASFLAALPMAALANPQGPLAVIGHMDLAWSYSYDGKLTGESTDAKDRYNPRKRIGGRAGHTQRMADLTKLARRDAHPTRIGQVFHSVLGDLPQVQSELTELYDRDAAQGSGAGASADPLQLADLWMLRQDLRAYVLLGDPAAYLSVQPKQRPAVSSDPLNFFAGMPEPATSGLRSGLDPESAVKAVLDCIREQRTPSAVAADLGVDCAEVERWVDAYMQAGREELSRMLRKR